MAKKLNLATINAAMVNTAILVFRQEATKEDYKAILVGLQEEWSETTREERDVNLYFTLNQRFEKLAVEAEREKKLANVSKKTALTSLFVNAAGVDLGETIRQEMINFQRYPRLGDAARHDAIVAWLSHLGINTDNNLATDKAVVGIIEAATSLIGKTGYKSGATFNRALLKGFLNWAVNVHGQLTIDEDGSYRVKGH